MNTTLKLKVGMLFAVIFFSIMTIIPSLHKGTAGWWEKAVPGLKLGLDLQGGMHLVLRVDGQGG